jgi:hypothetical protein
MMNSTQESQPALETRFIRHTALIWCSMAFVAIIAFFLRRLHVGLEGDPYISASASCLTMARAFNTFGALHMHFVPFQNNFPVGLDPDVYLHWPPLYPLVLAGFLRVFGETTLAGGRILELLIVLLTSAIVMLIASRLFTSRVALLSGFFYLTCRPSFEGSLSILHQPLAMLFASASVLFFLLAVKPAAHADLQNQTDTQAPTNLPFALLGVLSVILAILTAWDPIFVSFGLLAGAVYLRHRAGIRLAIAYISAAVLTFIGVQANYILNYPVLFKNQLATIAYRAGMHFNGDSSVRLHTIIDRTHYAIQDPPYILFLQICDNTYKLIGPIALLGCCLAFAVWFRSARLREHHPEPSSVWLLFGLGLPWIVWFIAMPNYVSIHTFPLVLATPFAAIASAVMLNAIWNFLSTGPRHKTILWVMVYIFPLLVLFPLIRAIHLHADTLQYGDFSSLIRATPPNAVVLTPCVSFVPIYYSRRHLVRGIQSDQWLQRSIIEAHAAFPGSPLFLALQDSDRKDFPDTLPHLALLAQQGDSEIYELVDKSAH